MSFNDLARYSVEDADKRQMIDDVLNPRPVLRNAYVRDIRFDLQDECDFNIAPAARFCPNCLKRYPEEENFCFECLVKLKDLKDVNVRDIRIASGFEVEKARRFNGFEEIFAQESLEAIERFRFTLEDFRRIITNIKRTVLKRLDGTVKENGILLDSLSINEKVLLFAKCFVSVGFKSYGPELGYFEFNRICLDDRQLPVLQITTLLHELSHFLLKEIIAHILCEVLDCSKTAEIESIAIFILSYTPVNRLIDEYAAHTVEGRFTLFGYQDFSSYLSIERTIDMPGEEIDVIKTIGNSFSIYIKEILESFIDDDLLEDIKDRFRAEIMDEPKYECLALENCLRMNGRGMTGAIRMMVRDGFLISMDNLETLKQYREQVKE